ATDDLASFALDLVGLDVEAVTVDGKAAGFAHDDGELRIELPEPVAAGTELEVAVDYGGRPTPVEDVALGVVGWITFEGGSFVVGEPDGARTWFPANDHPSDKATFRFAVTVPAGVEVAATGVLVEQVPGEGPTTRVRGC